MPGWHCIFEDLPLHLEGNPVANVPGRFQARKERYRAKFVAAKLTQVRRSDHRGAANGAIGLERFENDWAPPPDVCTARHLNKSDG